MKTKPRWYTSSEAYIMKKTDLEHLLDNLDGVKDGRKMRSLAIKWAKEHPDKNGYISIGNGDGKNYANFCDGGFPYRIENGKAKASSWEEFHQTYGINLHETLGEVIPPKKVRDKRLLDKARAIGLE